ncbi:LNS2-domain-containing protein [Marasmius fiardii PR-910]|nr:LNS2-domain-containing protein [Marasmius fiardii PR-910]
MNYLRGAVNAISAPYQYYKDLPPINPATLTGAIDVIVIQRPTNNGSTELACSPFHVRFGKLQVLRPSEKKVNVFVNGHPIPFDMKIGEAGEAFFVFETNDDVPDDLITSPLLTAQSEEESEGTKSSVSGEPDAKMTQDEQSEPDYLDLNATDQGNGSLPSPPLTPTGDDNQPEDPEDKTSAEKEQDERADAVLKRKTGKDIHAPHVLHQDGVAIDSEGYHSQPRHKHSRSHVHHYESFHHGRESSDRTVRAKDYDDESDSDSKITDYGQPETTETDSDPSPSPSAVPFLSYRATSEPPPNTDPVDFHPPQVAYPYTLSPDTSENGTATSLTIPSLTTSSSDDFLPTATPKPTHTGLPIVKLQLPTQEYSWEWGGFPTPSPMKTSFSFGKGGRPASTIVGPSRTGGHHASSSVSMNASTWSRTSTLDADDGDKGKGNLRTIFGDAILDPVTEDDNLEGAEGVDADTPEVGLGRISGAGRSKSVPPGLEGSPTSARHRRRSLSSRRWNGGDVDGEDDGILSGRVKRRASGATASDSVGGYGAGGLLSASRSDPTRFRVFIEGKMVEFELSLVERKPNYRAQNEDEEDEEEHRGRQLTTEGERKRHKLRVFSPDGRWTGIDEFEMAWLFDEAKIEFEQFLDDETVVNDPRLVIRWMGEKYISRRDESPLMGALLLWRDACIKAREIGWTRPSSPLSEDEVTTPTSLSATHSTFTQPTSVSSSDSESAKGHDLARIDRSQSEPPEIPSGKETRESAPTKRPPTSTSWAQWWSRSHKKIEDSIGVAPDPSSPSRRPELKEAFSAPPVPGISKLKPSVAVALPPPGSAPALPSTPVQKPVTTAPIVPAPKLRTPKKYVKTLRLTSDQLKSLNLKPGPNTITFSLSLTGAVACTARIFVWDSADQVVISDIDGTITKSDGLGHVFAMIGRDWTHLGVAKLYTDITRNGYKILYLTSRAIGQADATRGYLKGIKQNDYQLPEGPVIMSPDRLMTSLHREVIMRKPEVFKMACLRDLQRLFGEATRSPFYAGFGNRITDALSYRSVNVPSSRIFTIDSTGEVKCELLELAGYKSSYIHMTDLVDQMFPPIHRKWAPEFTDFNYWKPPIQKFPLPDLSPPSPTLSARSDTSNQSTLARLRNFSLVPSRQGSSQLKPYNKGTSIDGYRDSDLRQMSSFERLKDTLGFPASRSVSPERPSSSSSTWDSESEDENGNVRRQRRRSMTSMPGSLEDMHMDDEDEEALDQDEYDDEAGHEDMIDEEAAAEEAFDEDILAAGEMKNVPFL